MSIKKLEVDRLFPVKRPRNLTRRSFATNQIVDWDGYTGRILYFIDNYSAVIYCGNDMRIEVPLQELTPLEKKTDYNPYGK